MKIKVFVLNCKRNSTFLFLLMWKKFGGKGEKLECDTIWWYLTSWRRKAELLFIAHGAVHKWHHGLIRKGESRILWQQFLKLSTYKRDEEGVVKVYQKLHDVIYGWPLITNLKIIPTLLEQIWVMSKTLLYIVLNLFTLNIFSDTTFLIKIFQSFKS
jgi:hypothetical protein